MRIPSVLLTVFYLLIPSSANPAQEDQLPIRQENVKPTLADLLTIERSVSIFYTYARETELSALFSDEKSRLTLFAPTDKAVKSMSRKPCVQTAILAIPYIHVKFLQVIYPHQRKMRSNCRRKNLIGDQKAMLRIGFLPI